MSKTIIIGSGVAALQCARLLPKDEDIILITKRALRQHSSYFAQGGIAAVYSKVDSLQSHEDDTIQAGVFHNHQPHVQTLIQEGQMQTHQLILEGFPVDRLSDGSVSLGLEGAHQHNRILHSGGDATGQHLTEHLIKQLPSNVTIFENECVVSLLKNQQGRVIGIHSIHENGQHRKYFAEAVIVATGGCGSLYSYTSNCTNSFGDGIALAYLAGAKIADMEFIQFHPTLLYHNEQTFGLVSEAVRGAGARLINSEGTYIMDWHPLKDLAPRHITAKAVYDERMRGIDVFLKIDEIENFEEKFPTISNNCRKAGIPLSGGLLPITVGSHFLMGGILTNSFGATSIEGLYAIGEAACTGVHGANRLASNSLLEGIAFGKRLADHLSRKNQEVIDWQVVEENFENTDSISFSIEDLQQEMFASAGIIREKKSLESLLTKIDSTKLNPLKLNFSENEAYFMRITASLILNASLEREESRGAHIRLDFPNASPTLAQTIFVQQIQNPIQKEYWHEPIKT
ncbi:MAG TPA: L-aspartate oxidase [Kurthia sp.]